MPDIVTQRGRLTGDQKDLIVRLLAEFCPPPEIVSRVKLETDRDISIQLVYWYRDSPIWGPKIEAARSAFLNNSQKLPITSKYWRLMELQKLYGEADKARKVRAIRGDGKPNSAPFLHVEDKDFGACRDLLRQAAEELAQLRVYEHPDIPDRPRQVRLGGDVVPGSVAGLPEAGPVLDGEG